MVIDWHACDLFPPRQIDLVCVVRCDNKILYDRLKSRNYSEKKLQENLDCEIMEVLLQEARDAYDSEQVVELKSEKTEDLDSNVERIEQWVTQWKKATGEGARPLASTTPSSSRALCRDARSCSCPRCASPHTSRPRTRSKRPNLDLSAKIVLSQRLLHTEISRPSRLDDLALPTLSAQTKTEAELSTRHSHASALER